MRVILADDAVLLREGLARILTDSGFEVVGQAGDAPSLVDLVRRRRSRRRRDRPADAARVRE